MHPNVQDAAVALQKHRTFEKAEERKMDNLRQVTNPYLPSWEYIPDGEPYVFGDRVYVYGSHDKFNGDVYCMLDYVY